MEKPWKVIFAFVAVFIAGAVFGGLFTLRASGGRRPPGSGFAGFDRQGGPNGPGGGAWQKQGQFQGSAGIGLSMLGQLSRNLKLTDDQREKIRPIILKAAEEIQRQNIENTTKIVERMHLDIAAWLTPKQRDTLESMKLQMHERVRRAGMDMRGEVSPRGEGPQRRMSGQGSGRPAQPDGAAPASTETATTPANP